MFIETIRIENGQPALINRHLHRIQTTQMEFYGQVTIQSLVIKVPPPMQQGLYKCRMIYARDILDISFEPYIAKTIKYIKIHEATILDYHLKKTERTIFDTLKSKYPAFDEILITQQGFVTDTTYSNVLLFDGIDYFTPETYLLNGVQRQHLLTKNIIFEKKIHYSELKHFESLYLINAMLNWQDKIKIPISNITK